MEWCRENKQFSHVLSGVLSIMHPELYQLGQQAMCKLRETSEATGAPWVPCYENDRLQEVLEIWGHPWTALSIMVNRATPYHRDTNGRNPWMDLMVTVGEYEHGRLELPGLGVRLEYNPGTIVGLCGKVVVHGAAEVEGDRACLAYYMRNGVHERLGIPAGTWSRVSYWEQCK